MTGPRPISLLSALRPHQWAKNLPVFLPVIAAHKLLRLDAMSACAVAFVAFSLCASAVYVLNDLSNVDTDRQHPWKRHRSIAAGRISRSTGFLTADSRRHGRNVRTFSIAPASTATRAA